LLSLGGEYTAEQRTFRERTHALSQCLAPYNEALSALIAGGLGLLLVLAVLIYAASPRWVLWRRRLRPLTTEDVPEVAAYLEDLCRECGLSRRPTFVWNALSSAQTGLAFGRLGRYYVALSGGLVTQFYVDRALFRAVLLHELAHLRNADVGKTYFALAIAWAFAFAALVPFVLSQFGQPLDWIFDLLWRLLALTALVYLTLCALLRAREVHADVRASLWDGPRGALQRVLQAVPRRAVTRWRAPFSLHPGPGERLRALGDTRSLFEMEFWEAFATGLSVAIALPNVESLLSLVTIRLELPIVGYLLTGLAFAPLIVGVVGLGIWRTTFARLARGESPRGVGHLTLGLGVGVLLGRLLSLSAIASAASSDGSESVELLVFEVVWSALLIAGLHFFLRWIATGAAAWTPVAMTAASPRPAYIVGLSAAGAVLAVWLGLLFFGRDMGRPLASSIAGTFPALAILPALLVPAIGWLLLPGPVSVLAMIGLWAFPLGAWLWRDRVTHGFISSWALLDPSGTRATPPQQIGLHPRLALVSGLGGGLLFCTLLLLIRVWLQGLPESERGSDQFKVTFYFSQIALAAFIQAGVAAAVASRVRQLSTVHGLFAAFVVGCLAAAAILGLNLLFGGTLDAPFVGTVFWSVLIGGALLTLPSALVGSAVAVSLRRGRRESPDSEASPRAEVAPA
jgi:Zn-dependent protease with chaperone function